jgi:glucose-6-phosphate dehydrogenase assembly protein OpcA
MRLEDRLGAVSGRPRRLNLSGFRCIVVGQDSERIAAGFRHQSRKPVADVGVDRKSESGCLPMTEPGVGQEALENHLASAMGVVECGELG